MECHYNSIYLAPFYNRLASGIFPSRFITLLRVRFLGYRQQQQQQKIAILLLLSVASCSLYFVIITGWLGWWMLTP